MKYLKMFETHGSGYEVISDQDFAERVHGLIDGDRAVDFYKRTRLSLDKKEIATIVPLLQKRYSLQLSPPRWRPAEGTEATPLYYVTILGYQAVDTEVSTIFNLYKLTDEWYYLSIITYLSTYRVKKKYYRCDQFDGLLECLRTINI